MINPLANLFNKTIKSVPKQIQVSFNNHFPEAINIDWSKKEKGFEAVFYLNESEYISLFSTDGKLIEYKQNIWKDSIPESVKSVCEEQGEIMNVIAIHRENKLLYEIIVRDLKMNRTLLLFDENGKLIQSTKI